MIFDFGLFLVGLVGLYFGAEWLVGGAARLASRLGVSSFIVGLTLVSFGTSAPELVVSGLASYDGNGELAMGNVLGSNVANIALILGIASLLCAIHARRELILRDIPIMIALAVMIPIMGMSGTISRVEGAIFLVCFVAYVTHLAIVSRRDPDAATPGEMDELLEEGSKDGVGRDAALAGGGLVVLAVGANLLVDGAVGIATDLNVPEVVIGLTLVAIGTSLPELAASISAARRGDGDIVIGNVIGSNIFNVALILGVAALIRPIPISASVIRVDAPIVIALSVILLPLTYLAPRIHRREGGLLVAMYCAFLIWTTV